MRPQCEYTGSVSFDAGFRRVITRKLEMKLGEEEAQFSPTTLQLIKMIMTDWKSRTNFMSLNNMLTPSTLIPVPGGFIEVSM